jgi:hypothetical protein
MGIQYVLLVGGDTYDYRQRLTESPSLSFVPSLYGATDQLVRWAPIDPAYADVNDDGRPDVAIGRLPVRSSAEMATIVDKTVAYAQKTYGRTALFAADTGYDSYSQSYARQMPAGWTISTAHLDELGLEGAKAAIVAGINRGTAMTTYVGHSDDWVWSWPALFTDADALALQNAGRPTVVTQWGCWNAYYVQPEWDTLADVFLLSGPQGAAAVLGAVAMSSDDSEKALGDLLTPRLAASGTTVGMALLQAKAELAATHAGMKDVLLGWTLLGDPALVVEP